MWRLLNQLGYHEINIFKYLENNEYEIDKFEINEYVINEYEINK